MRMHKALYLRDDVDRLYVSRKEGGRGFASIEDCINAKNKKIRKLHIPPTPPKKPNKLQQPKIAQSK